MVYGYLRVSTDAQDINSQRQGVLALAEAKHLAIDEWIEDDGISGTVSPTERGLGRLLDRCKAGDILLCSEISRLGRKVYMVMSLMQTLTERKVVLMTAKEGFTLSTGTEATALAVIYSLISQLERDMIASRTKEGLGLRRKVGILLGRPRKTGVSEDSRINRDAVRSMIERGCAVPEIYNIVWAGVDYDIAYEDVYNYINRDAELNALYRTKVQNRLK